MNQDFEILIKLIVPAIVLIVWAINQVTNKEGPPQIPRRPMAPPRPPGGLPPAPMPGERPGPREVIWTEAPPPPPRRELPAGPDEIIILGTETRPVRPAPPRSGSSPRARSSRRPRPSASPPPRPEPPKPRSGLVGGLLEAGLRPTPLDMQSTPVPPPEPRSGVDLAPLRDALASPSRVREAVLLNEILQPPLALRSPRKAP